VLHQICKDIGLSHKFLKKGAAERDEVARIKFREFAQQNYAASMIVTVDEPSKDSRIIFQNFGQRK